MSLPSDVYVAFFAGREMARVALEVGRNGGDRGEYFRRTNDLYSTITRNPLTVIAGVVGDLSRPVAFVKTQFYQNLRRYDLPPLERVSIQMDATIVNLHQSTINLSTACEELGEAIGGLECAVEELRSENLHD